ncbi:MAG TPA: type II toxin-antitoxin system VapC family toxin [Rhizomicrobium sp.]|nr:type II toxin-antitoxin system VapC family toxin [Rhizomicrobium sp.]
MVIDSSAVFAVVFHEQDRALYLKAMTSAPEVRISAPTLFECRIVAMSRGGRDNESDLFDLLDEINAEIIPFDEGQVELAAFAYRRYGKGVDRASLNFGDCFSYALAKSRDEPLLYKGGDFARTDVAAAV